MTNDADHTQHASESEQVTTVSIDVPALPDPSSVKMVQHDYRQVLRIAEPVGSLSPKVSTFQMCIVK